MKEPVATVNLLLDALEQDNSKHLAERTSRLLIMLINTLEKQELLDRAQIDEMVEDLLL